MTDLPDIPTPPNEMIPEKHEWHAIMWSVIEKVRAYTGGSVGWIAKQSVSEHQPHDDLFGFTLRDAFASVRISDAVNADDVLIRQLATEIMGYAPESIEDYEAKRKDAIRRASDIARTIHQEAERLDYFLSVARGCELKLEALRMSNGGKAS